MKKKILIFPNQNKLATLKYLSKFINNYDINFLEQEHINNKEYFTNIFNTFDTILLIYNKNIPISNYSNLIEKLKNMPIKIVVANQIYEILKLQKNSLYKFIEKIETVFGSNYDYIHLEELIDLTIPVITILGSGPNTDKFHIQVYLNQYLRELGYNVLSFGTKEYSFLFDIDKLPDFLFENISFKEKILFFNNFIHKKSLEKEYDIIILGVPEGISALTNKTLLNMGELSKVLTLAAKPDISIFSTYLSEYDESFFLNMKNISTYSLNKSIDFFHLSNTSLMFTEKRSNEIIYLSKNLDIVENFLESTKYKMFNINNVNKRVEIFNNIIEILANNPISSI